MSYIQSEGLRADIPTHFYTVVHNSHVFVMWKAHYVAEYINYIASIVIEILKKHPMQVNILINSPRHVKINNSNKNIHITINFEHTLIKKPRGEVPGFPVGKLVDPEGENYYVRIEDIEKLDEGDIVIDYSIPNIYNIVESKIYDEFSKKLVYIAPCLYESSLMNRESRDVPVVTTFLFEEIPRRKHFLDSIRERNVSCINYRGLSENSAFASVFSKAKILVNIHQKDNCLTFEELRVLPALQCGTIVISEVSPFSQKVPYHNSIIWCSYDTIVDKVIDVLENYDEYHYNLFNNSENEEVLKGLRGANMMGLEEKILALK